MTFDFVKNRNENVVLHFRPLAKFGQSVETPDVRLDSMVSGTWHLGSNCVYNDITTPPYPFPVNEADGDWSYEFVLSDDGFEIYVMGSSSPFVSDPFTRCRNNNGGNHFSLADIVEFGLSNHDLQTGSPNY